MKPNILTRERLAVIKGSIERNGGSVTIRHLMRNHGLFRSVIDEAIEGGFLTVEIQKPSRGRPSQILKKVSQSHPTKIPPLRSTMEDCISIRHWNFAFSYMAGELGLGMFSFKRRAWMAYKKSFPQVKSNAAARASASRLMKKPHIRAAIQWEFATYCDHLRIPGPDPQTTSEIWFTLLDHQSYRARWTPWRYRQQWENRVVTE